MFGRKTHKVAGSVDWEAVEVSAKMDGYTITADQYGWHIFGKLGGHHALASGSSYGAWGSYAERCFNNMRKAEAALPEVIAAGLKGR